MFKESSPSIFRPLRSKERTAAALLGKTCGGGIVVSLGCEVFEIDAAGMLADALIEQHLQKIPQIKSQGTTRPKDFSSASGSHPGYRKTTS